MLFYLWVGRRQLGIYFRGNIAFESLISTLHHTSVICESQKKKNCKCFQRKTITSCSLCQNSRGRLITLLYEVGCARFNATKMRVSVIVCATVKRVLCTHIRTFIRLLLLNKFVFEGMTFANCPYQTDLCVLLFSFVFLFISFAMKMFSFSI